jgi:hypothetical protein
MNRNTRFIGIGLLVASSVIALAAADAITLKFGRKEGDVAKYKMAADMEIMGAKATVAAEIEDKITKVSDDGYVIQSTQSKVEINFNGQTMDQPDTTDTITYKANGSIVDLQTENMTPDSWRVAELSGFVLPDKAVNVGDEWTSTVAADEKKGTVAATASYKLEALEKVGSRDTAKVKVLFTETGGTDPASSEGYAWIDVTNGSIVKSNMTWKNVPIQGMAVNGTITMDRID